MTPAESTQVALELERLRGTMEACFARVDGSLALLVQRSDQTDRTLDKQGTELEGLEKRVDVLEADAKASATHGDRLSAVEKLVWIGVGLATAGGSAGGWLVSALVK